MDNLEEKQSNSGAEDKITTFASPAVLAAILDKEPLDEDVLRGMVDLNDREEEKERVADSLESSLNDSLELSKLREFGEPERVESNEKQTDDVSYFPKSSTPVQNGINIPDSKKVENPSKPRRPQHIVERNKERVGKRIPERTSYAQVHAVKTRSKVDKIDGKSGKHGEKSPVSEPGSGLESQALNSRKISKDFDQGSYFQSHVSPTSHDYDKYNYEQNSDLLQDSHLNGSLNIHHSRQHGPYYDVSQNSSMYYNTLESSYSDQLVGYGRGYQSAVANLRQSHAMAGSVPPLHYNPLSTQSAPPGVCGYQRKPLISNVHNLHEEEYYLSSALPNTDFLNSQKANKIPESSLHRKFSSEPYLAQSSSPALQNIANVGRSSKASGSYSSLRQPSFQYKPYTLKDYRNFVGAEVECPAGGLGPNVDTDEFKEKMRKVSKQREYAAMLRSQHATMKKQQERKGSIQQSVKPKHIKQAETKRQAALNYAKNVPKPKQMESRKRSSPGSAQYSNTRADDSQEITILEILRLRHEKEKKEVDTIRKDLASKIRL